MDNKQKVYEQWQTLLHERGILLQQIYRYEESGILSDDKNDHPADYEQVVVQYLRSIELLEEIERLMKRLERMYQ